VAARNRWDRFDIIEADEQSVRQRAASLANWQRWRDPRSRKRVSRYDASDGTDLYLYAGGNENAFLGDFFADVWKYSVADNAWTQLHDGEGKAPDPRIWANLEHDAANNQLILFAGHDETNLGNNNQLWTFNLEKNTWKEVMAGDVWNKPQRGVCDFPADFTIIDPASPERRQAAASAMTADGLLVVGGKTACGNIDDAWTYDPTAAAWTNHFLATAGEVCLRNSQSCQSMCF